MRALTQLARALTEGTGEQDGRAEAAHCWGWSHPTPKLTYLD